MEIRDNSLSNYIEHKPLNTEKKSGVKIETSEVETLPETSENTPIESELSIPPLTEEGEMVLELGDQLLNLPTKQKLSSELETPTTLGTTVTSSTASILSKIPNHPTTTISSTGVQELGIAVDIGMQAVKLFENNKVIEKARDNIALLKEQIHKLTPQGSPPSQKNQKKIEQLQQQVDKNMQAIESEIGKKKKSIEGLITSSLKGASSGTYTGDNYIASLAHKGTPLMHHAQIASSVGGSVFSILSIVLSSKELDKNRVTAKKIAEEKELLLQEKEYYTDSGEVAMVELISLRIQNLDQQLEDNKANTLKNAFSLTAGILGTAAVAKTMALALGATIAATAGSAITATGIGAAVIGVVGLVIGSGYFIYKKRHAIQHKIQNIGLSVKENSVKREITQLNQEQTKSGIKQKQSRDIYESTKSYEKNSEKTNTYYENAIEDMHKKISTLEEEIVDLKKQTPTNLLKKVSHLSTLRIKEREVKTLKNEIQNLITEKTNFSLFRSQVQQKSFQHAQKQEGKISKTSKKIAQHEKNLSELNLQQKELNDNYRFGKDIGKFAKSESGEDMSVQKLSDIHSKICPKTGQSEHQIEKIKQFFIEQNKRTKSNVDTFEFHSDLGPDALWDLIVQGVTAPVL